jgi:hypothetical protein
VNPEACGEAWAEGAATAPCVCDQAPTRDTQFRFVTQGAFAPILTTLITRENINVLPVSLSYLPPRQEVIVTDGLYEGLFQMSTQTTLITRQIN